MALDPETTPLVEIQGLDGPVIPVDEAAQPISGAASVDANGCVGRIITIDPQANEYVVHLSSDVLVKVPEAKLRPYTSPNYRKGGFDLMWPSNLDEFQMFALQATDILNLQGWCLVECISRKELRDEAWTQAQTLPGYYGPKPELVVDILGKGGSGKVTDLVPDADPENALTQGDLPPHPDALHKIEDELEDFSQALAQLAPDMLGFNCIGRRKTLVWLPFKDREETMRLRGEPIQEADVEDGVVERHLAFIKERKVGLLRMVDNEGGEIALVPREDISDLKPVKISATPNKLLLYRADYMSFSYKPRPLTKSLVMQTWLMEEPPEFELGSLVGGLDYNAEKIGIRGSSIMPPCGQRLHIGSMAGRMSANAANMDHCWAVYSSGTDSFVAIGSTRFERNIYCSEMNGEPVPGLSYCHHSSLAPDEFVFNMDNEFFNIPAGEVKFMSPSQRMLLEEGYNCLHQYGYTKPQLVGKDIPVYVGDTGSDFGFNIADAADWDGEHGDRDSDVLKNRPAVMALGASVAVTASRAAHCFGLIGQTSAVDTACSASLVGFQVAAANMRRALPEQGRSHIGTAPTQSMCCGISIQVGPFSFIALCAGTMLSKKGRCHTYNDTADGYARGEGAFCVLMTCTDSEADDREQLACMIGVSANQDGRSANLTAPNGPAQQACIRDSMTEAGMTAREICVAECHGTGTALGDPIEVGALRGVMEPRSVPLGETSAKSNVGHLEACAGVTGVIKCVMMMNASVSTPNIHLSILNHNLSMDGFPGLMATEFFDTMVDAGVSGVSSFGFGGTNARADLWGRARIGYHSTGVEKVEEKHKRHLQVQCPMTLGPIDYLTGEPISEVMLTGIDRRADVIRDALAPYDISRHAYTGGYRYRLCEPMDMYEEDLPEKDKVTICGSWNMFRECQEMERKGDGLYSITVVLGDTRHERFFLCLNGDREKQTIYPLIKNATPLIHILGPDHKMDHRFWSIDGRDEQVPTGTVYKINFKWGVLNKQVWWEKVSEELAPIEPPKEHSFSVIGTFTSWKPQEMIPVAGEPGVWEFITKIGAYAIEDFRFLRDGDYEQEIYPARPKTRTMGVPVQGPDDLCADRAWSFRGGSGDVVRLRLECIDGDITVSVSGDIAPKVWESIPGWDRHQYFAVGTWNDCELTPMVMDPQNPGVFKCRVTFDGSEGSINSDLQCYEYIFQICVDGERALAYSPACPDFVCPQAGKYVVNGPNFKTAASETKPLCRARWGIRSREVGQTFEILFAPGALDKRRIVTWYYVSDSGSDLPALGQ